MAPGATPPSAPAAPSDQHAVDAAPSAMSAATSTSSVAVKSLPIWRHPLFAEGAKDFSGIALGVMAWGLVAGVVMVQSGIGVGWAVLMQLTMFAGTAQLAVLPLIVSGAPLWVIWGTALCVNLRFVFLSAAWRPYFVDRPFPERVRLAYFSADINNIVFMRRFPEPGPADQMLPYFWGAGLVNWLAWNVPALVGIALADKVPLQWGVGFAGVAALLALTCTLLSDRATWVAAAVAGCASVAAYALPLKLNIVVAILAAVAAGLLAQPRTPVVPVTPRAPRA
jgi:predicted branched-subunit amino acid permease